LSLDKQLEELKAEYINTEPFESLLDYEVWSNKVSSLLYFDIDSSTRFKSFSGNAYVSWRMGDEEKANAFIKRSVEILDKAIVEAKSNAEAKEEKTPNIPVELIVPPKVTLRWLIDHVDIKHWVIAFSILITVFSTGVWVGQSDIYTKIFTESNMPNKSERE